MRTVFRLNAVSMRWFHRQRTEGGMTLVEVLVAVAILGVLITAVSRQSQVMLTSHTRFKQDADLVALKLMLVNKVDCQKTFDASLDTSGIPVPNSIVAVYDINGQVMVKKNSPSKFKSWTVFAQSDANGDIILHSARLMPGYFNTWPAAVTAADFSADMFNPDPMTKESIQYFDSANRDLLLPAGVSLCSATSSNWVFRRKFAAMTRSAVEHTVELKHPNSGCCYKDLNQGCAAGEFLLGCSSRVTWDAGVGLLWNIKQEDYPNNNCHMKVTMDVDGIDTALTARCIPIP
jgi:prepilin-type N-terminal cleavage/methylation domain-containing protein